MTTSRIIQVEATSLCNGSDNNKSGLSVITKRSVFCRCFIIDDSRDSSYNDNAEERLDHVWRKGL
jgi:hypothetical protein